MIKMENEETIQQKTRFDIAAALREFGVARIIILAFLLLLFVLALAKGLGSTKAGVLETDFREEATSDLFGEQAVLCGGVTALIEAGFDTLIKAGYKAEIAYFEVLHELKLIVDLIQAGGMMHMWDSVSNTAEYGGLTRRDKVINAESRKAMKQILEDINSGKFAEEWTKEWTVDLKHMKALEKEESEKQIEQVGREIRKLFERS